MHVDQSPQLQAALLLFFLAVNCLAQTYQPARNLGSLASQWIGEELPFLSQSASGTQQPQQQPDAIPAFLFDLLTACRTALLDQGSSGAAINGTQMLEQAQSWMDALTAKFASLNSTTGHPLLLDTKLSQAADLATQLYAAFSGSLNKTQGLLSSSEANLMEDLAMSRRLNLTLPAIALVKAPLAAARLKVLELVDHLVSLPGALEGVINNYWTATYQRYASYADSVRVSAGLNDQSGGLTQELVARFREVTGTTCSDAVFRPPQDRPAALIGTGASLSISYGNCQLSRVASQTRRDFLVRCLPRYGAPYTTPVAFTGSVCRRQLTYGTASSTRIELWNPRDIVFPGNSTTAQNLRAAAAGGNTIVSRTIARDQYITSVVRQRTAALQKVLSSLRGEFTFTLTQGPRRLQKLTQSIQTKLQAAGFGVASSKVVGALQGELAGRREARGQALSDLKTIFPDLLDWKLGEGVGKIFDHTLAAGLASTLYSDRTSGGGAGGGASFMGQSAAGLGSRTTSRTQQEQQQQQQPAGMEVPADIFQRLAVEMEKLLVARSLAQEDAAASPPPSQQPANATDGQAPANRAGSPLEGVLCRSGADGTQDGSMEAWQQDSSIQDAGALGEGRSVPGSATRAYAGCQALIGTVGRAFAAAAVKLASQTGTTRG